MSGPRILIVEDENIVAKDLEMILKRLGYEVVASVATGEDAVVVSDAKRPDLVLMDIALRGSVDGIEAAGIIRERYDVPVVYLTAHADNHTLQRAKVTDPFGYVLKPFEERELHTAIQMALHKHRIESEIRKHRQWLATTLRSIGDAVIATDREGKVTLMNPVAEAITGWTEREAAGRPLKEVFNIVNEFTRKAVQNPVEQVLESGRIVGLANHTLLISRDGREMPIDDSAAPIQDVSGQVLGVVLVFRDVTERRRLEAALVERSRMLEEADQRKNEFLAVLAHELRNPLAPIRSGLEILREAKEHADLVEVMMRQVEHMVRLIDDLLDVSRITQGRIQLQKEWTGIHEIARRAVETVRPVIDGRQQRLEVVLPEEPVFWNADVTRMAQVLGNLLTNASKFSDRGGQIELSATREGDRLLIRVRDDGIGMGPERLSHLFQPFVRRDSTLEQSQEGLGIGLSLAQKLVGMHGGEITARSEGEGKGAEFTIVLPLPDRAEEAQPAQPSRASASPSIQRRVLVVDDSVPAATLLAQILERSGQTVAVAHDGEHAMEVARRFHPDLILLDIGLPGMNGYELARRIRQQPALMNTILIALTGYGTEADRKLAEQAGCDYHLVKPIAIEKLLEIFEKSRSEGRSGSSAE